jgi:aminomethyltransferase
MERAMADPTDDLIEAETPIPDLILPLDDWHREHGARMVSFAGYEMPIQYEGIMAEHLWTREHAGLFDVSHMGQLVIFGEGADAALERLLPADLAALKPGRLRYSLLLAEDGGILDDLIVTRLGSDDPFAGFESTGRIAVGDESGAIDPDHAPDPACPHFYMVVNGATKWDDIAHLREHLPDAVTINHLEEQALLALQGPEAEAVLAELVPGVGALGYMQGGAFPFEDMSLWISRSGYTGEDGFEISVPAGEAVRLADALIADDRVMPVGLGARDSLRLEAGLPLYGHDLDPETTPVAAGLAFALSKRRREQGGFMGAERILGEHGAGAASVRVGLAIAGRQPVREGAAVLGPDGAAVGRVTSGGHAPSLGRPIAMAYVPADLAAPDTALTVEQRGKRIAATVCAMPFVPNRTKR